MRSKTDEQLLIDRFRMNVLEQAESERRKRRFNEKLLYTSMALQEVTGMAPEQIDAFAGRAQMDYTAGKDPFFSVSAQLAWMTVSITLIAITVWLTAIW